MRRWDRLLDGYLEEYSGRGLRPETVAKVAQILTTWGTWMKRRRPRPKLEQVDAELLTAYIRSRKSFRAKATVYGVLSAMRGMGDYLVREGVWLSNPLRWMKGPKVTPYSRLPKRISEHEMELLWQQVASKRSAYQRHLWIAVLSIFYGTGVRLGELVRLDVTDWDRQSGMLLVDGRKTGRERRVPAPEIVQRCLEAYLPHRHNLLERHGRIEEPALLVNRDGGRLLRQSVRCGIRGLAAGSGITLHSLHQFRHSCASDMLEAGARLHEVQRFLGHQAISTTVRYVHLADPQRREAISRHPINDWLAVVAA